ncbi:DeoR/GlpR family DNA-binding transcription regulator [Microbacterium sp. zg.Y625]|uniref:DeoR/GlpR family DNA-binding transcription regulator n=1 Tax=Microbacterium jiangjiandongii TaxID=3049071 RepID=UPI00214C3DDF|nr:MULTISPECIES: DeoR/GlpR family DNA-binding transcription regulator [unclassified Microbacterium]MCR2793511.1 DeoR/GlpR family DNA-binding transcription regulator [Microbacterium sp. zg.Y625]MCR2815889.1 DeoR/GlpR family DNA-binding transcription regulator [Microbacterium sp. zg.Y843]WIM25865.1 DeoR/GlpR family DNA-binding transcription regulator [Microbacterium sp. zg-Y625]
MSRQAQILELLAEQGFQSVASLADAFGVTASTIRRDLDQLEARELIQRTHGGALPSPQYGAPFDLKSTLHRKEKVAIGKAMADRILDGQTVLMDSGTTTLEVARHLASSRVTIVTNDLQIGLVVAERQRANLVFIGGELLPNDVSMWGPTSVQQLQNLRVNVAILGCDTVLDDGLYSTSSYEIELKRTMLSIAGEAFFVADSTKFGREALFKCFDLSSFTAGITDSHLDPLRAATFPVPLIRATIDDTA